MLTVAFLLYYHQTVQNTLKYTSRVVKVILFCQIPDSGEDVAPLDVMFWIHGGGWFTGSGNTDMYGPQYLLDKDVILVTINYRLGTLGTFYGCPNSSFQLPLTQL
jgi:acetylcholinesterase